MLNGLTNVNIELTSRCNKSCHMCGRRKIERDYPHLAEWGDMDYELVESIAHQIPPGIVCQFHDNGEPLLFPRLGEALQAFRHCIRTLDTNGKLLMEKADEIIGNLETITISTFEGDEEAGEQFLIVRKFLIKKGQAKPDIIIRTLGNTTFESDYRDMGLLIAKRQFHSPVGNFDYQRQPTIPEIGICINALSHMAIKRTGMVHLCVKFDPEWQGVIGDATKLPLERIWNGGKRKGMVRRHIEGKRNEIPFCAKCSYWGVPTA